MGSETHSPPTGGSDGSDVTKAAPAGPTRLPTETAIAATNTTVHRQVECFIRSFPSPVTGFLSRSAGPRLPVQTRRQDRHALDPGRNRHSALWRWADPRVLSQRRVQQSKYNSSSGIVKRRRGGGVPASSAGCENPF